MKRAFLTAAALIALTAGASAQGAPDPFSTGDSHGPRSPQNGTGCHCSAPRTLVAQAGPRYEFNAGVWQPFAVNPNAVDAAELRRQQAANREWRYHAYERANRVGVWSDGVLPTEFAAQAWNKLSPGDTSTGRSPNPEPQIGSGFSD